MKKKICDDIMFIPQIKFIHLFGDWDIATAVICFFFPFKNDNPMSYQNTEKPVRIYIDADRNRLNERDA